MPPLKLRGPRVSVHHTQENAKAAPRQARAPARTPASPPSLPAAHKAHVAALSKHFRFALRGPPFPPLSQEGNASVLEWKRYGGLREVRG